MTSYHWSAREILPMKIPNDSLAYNAGSLALFIPAHRGIDRADLEWLGYYAVLGS